MNEPLDPSDPLASIEVRLQRIAPAQLSSEISNRLIAADPGRKVIPFRWQWITLAAAASLAIAAVWLVQEWRSAPSKNVAFQAQVTPESLRIFAPIATRNLLLDAREIGVIEPENSPPIRLVHCVWLDDSTYRADDGGSDLAVTRTREQIIPVALEVY